MTVVGIVVIVIGHRSARHACLLFFCLFIGIKPKNYTEPPELGKK